MDHCRGCCCCCCCSRRRPQILRKDLRPFNWQLAQLVCTTSPRPGLGCAIWRVEQLAGSRRAEHLSSVQCAAPFSRPCQQASPGTRRSNYFGVSKTPLRCKAGAPNSAKCTHRVSPFLTNHTHVTYEQL